MSIRTRLFLNFLGVAFATLAITGLFIYLGSRAALMEGVRHHLLAIAQLQRLRVDDWVSSYRDLAGVLTAQEPFRTRVAEGFASPESWPRVSSWLIGADTGAETVRGIHVVDPEAGVVLASSTPEAVGRPLPYPLPAPEDRHAGARVSIVPSDPTHGVAVVAIEIRLPAERSAILVLEGDMDELAESVTASGRFGRSGETIVGSLAPDGRPLVLTSLRYREVPLLESLPWVPPGTPMGLVFGGEAEGLLQEGIRDYRGVPVLAVGYPISEAPWNVIVKLDLDEALAPLRGLLRALIAAVLAGALLAALLSTLVARSLVRPLRILAETAGRDEPIPPAAAARPDELGVLARALSARDEATRRSQAELSLTLAGLEERVEERTRQLRDLAAELVQAEQRERRRLAHVLHDHLQQLLVAARLRLPQLRPDLAADRLEAVVGEVTGLLDESIQATRSLAVELSPPVLYQGDFAAALAWLAERIEAQHGLRVGVIGDDAGARIDDDTRAFLFGAVRELLFNVVKHAGTDRAEVRLDASDGWISVAVADRGRGWAAGPEPAAGEGGHFGLFSIREQIRRLGGRFETDSRPGRGTTITLGLPLAQ